MTAWRPAVMGRNGVVASAHPAASLAGLKVLMNGGNAVDAAVAVASTLNVAEPYMSGLGGDGIMLITTPGANRPVVLDYSGPAPSGVKPEEMTADDMMNGPKAPLVPGAPAGWFAALEQYGTRRPDELLSDAIELAENGSPVTHKNAMFIRDVADRIRPNEDAASTFLENGGVPRPGSLLRQPRLAATYRAIAQDGPDAFYRGAIGEELVRSVQAAGGYLSMNDLTGFEVQWQQPICAPFMDFEIYGAPPPACSLEYLQLLRILEGEDLGALGHNSADYLHLLIESIKLASADRIEYTMRDDLDLDSMLSDDYIVSQRARLDRDVAAMGRGERYGAVAPGAVKPGSPAGRTGEHTTHFAVADASGMAVNVTQSIGSPFGSGFMAGETGIMLNNFVNWTDLDRSSPNALEPGKQMENCMSPAQIYLDGRFYATLGTPGSWGILQTTPQMMLNLLVHGMNIQEAIEAPRIRFMGGKTVIMEERVPADVRAELEQRGHEITPAGDLTWQVGGGHGTRRDPESGVLSGGADPRRDGYAMAW
jgi:gamma-glutamyltranspeptidase / glutathione hydrolase